MSSRSLQGYTTINKSLTGIITISDGAGTTISDGIIKCNTLFANDLTTNNITFTGDMNNEFTFTDLFNNLLKVQEIYTALGGYGAYGIPIWSNVNNEIRFPTNIKITGELGCDNAVYFNQRSNTFTYPIREEDVNFNKRGYLQLAIESDGTTVNGTGVAGIDFGSWNGRTNASCRIYALDNANYSSDMIFVTAPSGSDVSTPTKRLIIKADGNIGINTTNPLYNFHVIGDVRCSNLISDKIGTLTNENIIFETLASGIVSERMRILNTGNVGIGQSNPTYKLDVTGNIRATTGVTTNGLISTSITTTSNVYGDKTTGNINIGGALTTGVLNLGNVGNASSTTIYGTTNGRIIKASVELDTNKIEPLNTTSDMIFGNTLTAKMVFGSSASTMNNMELNAITGQLKGTQWEVLHTIPSADNTKKIANTEWVNANTITQSMGITQSNNNNFNFISNSTNTTGLSFSNICMAENGETGYIFNGLKVYKTSDSGSNWVHCHSSASAISCICCSNTGQFVYYSLSGASPPLYSSNFGQTFSIVSGIVPQNNGHKIFCSYDGSIVCLTYLVTLSGLVRPNYNVNYGSTSSWVICSYCPITGNSGINDLILDGSNGVLNSMTIAAGKSGTLDYVHYSNSPGTLASSAWVTKLTASVWSSLSFKQNNKLFVGHAIGTAGIHLSTDSGVSYSVISSTIGYTINCVDASRDGTHIFFGNSGGFYYSSNSGNSFTNFSTTVPNFLVTSQSGKTTMVVPASTNDTIYTFFTNPKVTFKTDIQWPKNRVVLQSNSITDYSDNIDIFYPYRTQFLGLDITLNNFYLYYPLYENYVIRPQANATCYLPEVTERHLGIKITIIRMTNFSLNFVCAGTNLLWNWGSFTGVTTLATSLSGTITTVTLMASYGLTVANPYAWVIVSSP